MILIKPWRFEKGSDKFHLAGWGPRREKGRGCWKARPWGPSSQNDLHISGSGEEGRGSVPRHLLREELEGAVGEEGSSLSLRRKEAPGRSLGFLTCITLSLL